MLLTAQPTKAQDNEKVEDLLSEEYVSSLDFLKFENIEYNFFKNKNEQAVEDFSNKKFKKARKKFSSNYNKAVTVYRQKKYADAEALFSKSDSISSTYNKGNAQLMQLKAEEAIKSYEDVLKRNPNHKNAKHNLEIAKKILEKQKREQKKNEEDTKKNNPQDKNNKQEDKKDEKNSENSENGDADNKNKDDKKDDKNQKNKEDKENKEDKTQLDFGGKSKQNKKPQENPLNTQQNELEINAERIFKKIGSDPEKLLKNRFKAKEIKAKTNNINTKPW